MRAEVIEDWVVELMRGDDSSFAKTLKNDEKVLDSCDGETYIGCGD